LNTSFIGEFYHLNWCPVLLDHYRGMELFLGRKKAIGFFVIISSIGFVFILVEFLKKGG